jgi:hypothetical protein
MRAPGRRTPATSGNLETIRFQGRHPVFSTVIPAKAGIHFDLATVIWIPAFAGTTACAGMTPWEVFRGSLWRGLDGKLE